MQPTDPYLLNPVLNALGSIQPEEAHEAVQAQMLAAWAAESERLAAEAVGPAEWEKRKDAVAKVIEDEDFEDISAEQAAGKLVAAHKKIKASEAAEQGRRQAGAVVRAAREGSYRDLIG